VEIDLRSNTFEIIPALVSNGNGFGNEPVSAIAVRERALIAVNGGYFAVGTGVTLGALMINGEWIRPPLNRRACLCITRSGRLFIENLGLNANVRFGEMAPLPVEDINTYSVARGLNIFTSAWGGPLPSHPSFWSALIIDGQVRAIQPIDAVPTGAAVVIAKGPLAVQLASQIREGDPVELAFETVPPSADLLHVIGAGPRLLQGGGVFVSSEAELFTGKYFNMNTPLSRAPRSALGITRDGRLLLVVVDGRQPELSTGLTLKETAIILRELGAYEAINLDGGGSSTLVINGQVVNSPSDGKERRVTTALVIRQRSAFASKGAAAGNH
jgi:hypothetical protein